MDSRYSKNFSDRNSELDNLNQSWGVSCLAETLHTVGFAFCCVTLKVSKGFGVFLQYWCHDPMDPWPLLSTWTSTYMFSISKFLNFHPCILHIDNIICNKSFNTTREDWVLEWVKETNAIFAIVKELLLHELKWHINWFESCLVPGYQVENLVAQWARDFKNLSDHG